MSDAIATRLKYKEALIVKHLLRDKPNRDADEERLLIKVMADVEMFRSCYKITPKEGNNNE